MSASAADPLRRTAPPGPRFRDALVLAATLHADQRRKGSDVPFVSHPLAVASLVIEAGGDEDEAIAALLHDVVEDQGGLAMADRVRAEFGDRVADIVLACSDSTEVDPARKSPWRARKEAHLPHLRTADASVALVTAADKVHNARTILADLRREGHVVWERFSGRRDGTLWWYGELLQTLRANPAAPAHLVEELERLVVELKRWGGPGPGPGPRAS